MSLTRRTFLKGVVAAAGALILPPTLDENAEAARRFWALDSTMLSPRFDAGMSSFNKIPTGWQIVWRGPEHLGMCGHQVAAYRYRFDLPPVQVSRDYPPVYPRMESYTSPIVFEPFAPDPGYSARHEAFRLLAREMGMPLTTLPDGEDAIITDTRPDSITITRRA